MGHVGCTSFNSRDLTFHSLNMKAFSRFGEDILFERLGEFWISLLLKSYCVTLSLGQFGSQLIKCTYIYFDCR